MAGLDPAIQGRILSTNRARSTKLSSWIAGSIPAMTGAREA